jgi:hypothetical protein
MPADARRWLRRDAMIALPIENGLTQLQRLFAEAIFSDDRPIPATIRAASGPASASRFGVYRNNVIAGLMNAVAARYPVVRKLLWDDSFDRVARLYVTAEPPRSPVLLEYGETFPRFLRQIGEGAAVDYLADIADLEAARTRAYHAADAKPLGKSAFAKLSSDQMASLRLKLHPSVALLKSRFPAVSIWEANLYDNDNTISEWKQESALIARPDLHVEVRRLSAGAYEFLSAISAGRTVGSAIARAMANAPEFDLAECFTSLISADIVIGFEAAEDLPHAHI